MGARNKKNGAYKKIEAKPPSDSVSGEREAKHGKEGKESESEKKTLAVGWEHRETGACRSGVGRGNQEGGAPVVQLTKMYHAARSPFGPFSAPFSGTSRVSKRGPGRLTKVDGSQSAHTHALGKPMEPFWDARLRLSSASHHRYLLSPTTPIEGGRQAAVRKWVRSRRPRPPHTA